MPNRILKESVCTSDSIDALSWFEEVLFYRLITKCDDYGRYDGRAAIIKGNCFPLKDITNRDIEKALNKLSAVGLVRAYEVQGRPYLQLVTWEQHQQIRAKKSKYPSCENICNQMISNVTVIQSNTIQSESEYNPNARSVSDSVRKFGEAYPCSGNNHLVEIAFIDCLMTKQVTEEQLISAAVNYADRCKRLKTDKQYMKLPENFLRDMEYCQYLPGVYEPPEPKATKNANKGMLQNDYDFDSLEKELLSN